MDEDTGDDGADDGAEDGGDDSGDGGATGDDGGGGTEGDGGTDTGGEDDGPPPSPYQAGWEIGDCQDDIVPTGNQVGGVAQDRTMLNQYGEQLRFYDFCHKAIYIPAGAFW